MTIKRRLERLEEISPTGPADPRERERLRAKIREAAEQINDIRWRDHKEPLFEITGEGDVICTYDGLPVETSKQTLAEEWYWQYLEWGARGHDEETEAFYTSDGKFALSRMDFDFPQVFRLSTREGS